MAAYVDDEDDLECSLRNIVEQTTLKWIFVGGKGGVGKTTTSCSLAVRLSEVRENVLVVSTDPAHNLSDAFRQKFSTKPTLVDGFSNLFCMEVDSSEFSKGAAEASEAAGEEDGLLGGGLLKTVMQSFPGIDEAASFAELMKSVTNLEYSCIVFDTAPTGHTLRLLSFPDTMGAAFEKLLAMKDKFGSMMSAVSGMMGGGDTEGMIGKLESMKVLIEEASRLFKDPDRTTFVCVCIPEFLSLYETERLVQELAKFEIDTHNIVVNQILYTDDEASSCKYCLARRRMQGKYLSQIGELYADFNVVYSPMRQDEVRGSDSLREFGKHLTAITAPPPPVSDDDPDTSGSGGGGGGKAE